jgi:hypothetical protein
MRNVFRQLKLLASNDDTNPILPLYRNKQHIHRIFFSSRRIFLLLFVVVVLSGLTLLIARPLQLDVNNSAPLYWFVLVAL